MLFPLEIRAPKSTFGIYVYWKVIVGKTDRSANG